MSHDGATLEILIPDISMNQISFILLNDDFIKDTCCS